jgi:microcystin-dependent protein
MKQILILLTILLQLTQANAQVGINKSDPNPFAVLDIQSTNKGLLLPRLTTNERLSMLASCGSNCPDGAMVFDTDKKAFYYIASNKWQMLNPFVARDSSLTVKEPVSSNTVTNTVIQLNTTNTAGRSLLVDGRSEFMDSISVVGSISATKHLRVANDIRAGDRITSGGGIAAGGVITAPNFSSNFSAINTATPVPPGVIVMWSGATIPSGWAVCDGTNNTPDLRGRFIVGSGTRDKKILNQSGTVVNSGTLSFNIGDTAGVDEIFLSTSQLPSHTHTATVANGGAHVHEIYFGGWNSGGIGDVRPHLSVDDNGCCSTIGIDSGGIPDWKVDHGPADGSHSHTVTIGSAGGSAAVENKPPYYVLTFIMKL